MTQQATPQPDKGTALEQLYRDFPAESVAPLWTQRRRVNPDFPSPQAVAKIWQWDRLARLAERASELVRVGEGGERRVIALANPGLQGEPHATPTLWAGIQCLNAREVATVHRHSQGAFRFVLEGEGVWTVVDGDSLSMCQGDLILTPAMSWHEHINASDSRMMWIDGLDVPLVARLDANFFEPGEEGDPALLPTPPRSRSEALWGAGGLAPVSGVGFCRNSPLMAYRWAQTDESLEAQLGLEEDGYPGVVEPGHAAVRFTNPATGADALTTMRLEMHRLAPGNQTATVQTVGSSVWQVFRGRGTVHFDGQSSQLEHGDLVAVPSWCAYSFEADRGQVLDLFTYNDAPVYEALDLMRRGPLPPSGKAVRAADNALRGGHREVVGEPVRA